MASNENNESELNEKILNSNVQTLTDIVNDLIKIVNELSIKVDKMNQIEASCKNMDRHIEFVEETYNNLCQTKPFLLASKVSNFLRRDTTNKSIEN